MSILMRQIMAISAYMVTSIMIVYFNRWLFTDIFPYPVFISWVQQIVGLFLYYVLAFIGEKTDIRMFKRFHWIKIDPAVMYHTLPQILTFTLFVGGANLCLQFVQVSTYQVARSLSLIFTIILSKILVGIFPTKLGLCGAGLIGIGFVINSLDPSTLSLAGLSLGAFSSFFQSLNGVLVSKNMKIFENDGQKLLLYNLAGASLTMLPLVFLSGEQDAFAFLPLNPLDAFFITRWGALLISGALCICFNLAQFLVIDSTSPVSMTVIGFSKSIVQSLGGILVFGDIVTIESLGSLFLSFCGTGLYAFAQISKQMEDMQEKSPDSGAQIVEDYVAGDENVSSQYLETIDRLEAEQIGVSPPPRLERNKESKSYDASQNIRGQMSTTRLTTED